MGMTVLDLSRRIDQRFEKSDVTVLELSRRMDQRFGVVDVQFEKVLEIIQINKEISDKRFNEIIEMVHKEGRETRHHFDVVAERNRKDMLDIYSDRTEQHTDKLTDYKRGKSHRPCCIKLYNATVNTTDPIFAGLNPEQCEAVNTLKGPLLILAGAGSGKTRTITHRIANLIAQGVQPWQILAVTFTNKAANELKERIKRILKLTDEQGSEHTHLPLSGTFHSICVRILRRDIESIGRNRTFVIYDSDDQEKVMQSVLRDMHIAPEELKPRTALSIVSGFKSEAVSVSDARKNGTTYSANRMGEIYAGYQKKLIESNALDFDDLLLETVRLFTECPEILERYRNTWRFLHVDEYQDTNRVQYLFISLLAARDKNLCVIGDPDQSIYA